MEQKIKNIKEKILNYVNSNEVSIKPKWHFIFKLIFKIIAILIVFLAIVYFISFSNLVIYEKESLGLLNMRNFGHFVFTLPWLILFLSLVLLIVLEFLIRKFSFVYKKPLIYSLFGLIFIVLVIGFALNRIDNQFRFARFGERPEMPILGPMHQHFRGTFGQRYFDRKPPRNFEKNFMMPMMPRQEIPGFLK